MLKERGMVAHACDPSTWETEAEIPRVQGHPGLYSKSYLETRITDLMK